MFSNTIFFVSGVTWNGCIDQHQSPSKKMLFGSFAFSIWHVLVFPTPMHPPIRYNFFNISFPPKPNVNANSDKIFQLLCF